jgi:hypothetical protein
MKVVATDPRELFSKRHNFARFIVCIEHPNELFDGHKIYRERKRERERERKREREVGRNDSMAR